MGQQHYRKSDNCSTPQRVARGMPFHPNRERFLTNSHFIHYVNIISENQLYLLQTFLKYRN